MKLQIAIICLFSWWIQNVSACSCAEPPPPSEALKNAGVVFVGTVVSGQIDGDYDRRYVFTVSEIIKGDIGDKAVVFTARNDAICGYNFNIGAEYLIYATIYNNALRTTICTRTKPLSNAKSELEELRGKP